MIVNAPRPLCSRSRFTSARGSTRVPGRASSETISPPVARSRSAKHAIRRRVDRTPGRCPVRQSLACCVPTACSCATVSTPRARPLTINPMLAGELVRDHLGDSAAPLGGLARPDDRHGSLMVRGFDRAAVEEHCRWLWDCSEAARKRVVEPPDEFDPQLSTFVDDGDCTITLRRRHVRRCASSPFYRLDGTSRTNAWEPKKGEEIEGRSADHRTSIGGRMVERRRLVAGFGVNARECGWAVTSDLVRYDLKRRSGEWESAYVGAYGRLQQLIVRSHDDGVGLREYLNREPHRAATEVVDRHGVSRRVVEVVGLVLDKAWHQTGNSHDVDLSDMIWQIVDSSDAALEDIRASLAAVVNPHAPTPSSRWWADAREVPFWRRDLRSRSNACGLVRTWNARCASTLGRGRRLGLVREFDARGTVAPHELPRLFAERGLRVAVARRAPLVRTPSAFFRSSASRWKLSMLDPGTRLHRSEPAHETSTSTPPSLWSSATMSLTSVQPVKSGRRP